MSNLVSSSYTNVNYKKVLITTFAIFLILDLLLSVFNYPITESWWETYGYLINNGYTFPDDLYVAFPPLIPYLFSLYLKYGGDKIIFDMVIGVFLHAATLALLYKFLILRFTTAASLIALIFSTVMLMKSPTYFPRDYHQYVNLTTLILLFSLRKNTFPNQYLRLFVFGNLIVLSFIVKPNVGLFVFLSVILITIVIKQFRGLIAIGAGSFVGLFTYTIIAYQFTNEDPFYFLASNDSKGDIHIVLFRFLLDKFNRDVGIVALLIVFIFALSRLFKAQLNLLKDRIVNLSKHYFGLFYFKLSPFVNKYKYHVLKFERFYFGYIQKNVPIILFVIAFYFIASLTPEIIFGLFLAGTAIVFYTYFACSLAHSHKSNISDVLLSAVLISLAYSNTNTAGYSYDGMYISIAYVIAYFYDQFKSRVFKVNVSLFAFILILPLVYVKVVSPYSWWGLSSLPLYNSKHSLPYDELMGIKVPLRESLIYSKIKKFVDSNSTRPDDTLFAPSIPQFYFLNKKLPPIKTVVEWYDVYPYKAYEIDKNYLSVDKISNLVLLIPSKSADEGHILMRQKLNNFKYIYDWFIDNELNNMYIISDLIILPEKSNDCYQYIESELEYVCLTPLVYEYNGMKYSFNSSIQLKKFIINNPDGLGVNFYYIIFAKNNV